MRDVNISFPIDRLRGWWRAGSWVLSRPTTRSWALSAIAGIGRRPAPGGPPPARGGQVRSSPNDPSARTGGVLAQAETEASHHVDQHGASTEKVKPPARSSYPSRSVALGRAEDPGLQHRVLRAALDLLLEPARFCATSGRCRDGRGATARCRPRPSNLRRRDRRRGERARLLGQHAQWLARSGGRTARVPAASARRRCPIACRCCSTSPPARRWRPRAASRRAAVRFIRYLTDDLRRSTGRAIWR